MPMDIGISACDPPYHILPVVCLLGDGCFQMTCGEVATAKRLGITLPVVVLDD